MTVRTLYDFTGNNLARVPTDGQIYFSYFNGADTAFHVDQAAFKARFPYPPYARGLIDVTGTAADVCSVLDYEPGDANQATAIEWVQSYKKLHPGEIGTVYVNESEFVTFVPAAAQAGQVIGKDYQIWLARPGAKPTVSPAVGVVAVQYELDAGGGTYDVSAVFDDSWHPSPVAVPVPPVQAANPLLVGQVVYIQEGFKANASDVAVKAVSSKDGGKNWA